MPDARESIDPLPNQSASTSEQWLGGEAFLGQDLRTEGTAAPRRTWSHAEALVIGLGALTLGTALGILFSRSSR